MCDRFQWVRLLAFVTGLVSQELLLRNEHLAAENRILRAHLPSRLRLSDPERPTPTEIAGRLTRKALEDSAWVAKPDTILAMCRGLIAQKFDGSRHRAYPGRPRVSPASVPIALCVNGGVHPNRLCPILCPPCAWMGWDALRR